MIISRAGFFAAVNEDCRHHFIVRLASCSNATKLTTQYIFILLNFDRTSVVRKKYKHIAVKGRYSH